MSSRANRLSYRKLSNNLLRQVCCNSRSEYRCDKAASTNSGWDACATHGDGVRAVNSTESVIGVFLLVFGRVRLFAESARLSIVRKTARRLHLAEPSTMSTNGMTTTASRPLSSNRDFDVHQRQLPSNIWALAVATLVLGLAYAPNFRDLYSTMER